MRMLLAVGRRPHSLFVPGWVFYSRHPLVFVIVIIYTSLLFRPYLQALRQVFIYAQEDLHALQLFSHIKGNSSSSCSPLSLLKEPISFHCNAPARRAIPPCLCDPNTIVALQLHTSTSTCLFPMHWCKYISKRHLSMLIFQTEFQCQAVTEKKLQNCHFLNFQEIVGNFLHTTHYIKHIPHKNSSNSE